MPKNKSKGSKVERELFMKFIPQTQRQTVEQKIKNGWTGVLEFKDQCPVCESEEGESFGIIKFRRLKNSN